MRGETNSAPTGGGLKVIASGTVQTAIQFDTSSAPTVTFPQPAAFVLCGYGDLMLLRNAEGNAKMGAVPMGYSLSQDGLTLTYGTRSPGLAAQGSYIAYG